MVYKTMFEETQQRAAGTSGILYRTALTSADKSQLALNSALFKTPNQLSALMARVFVHTELNTAPSVDYEVWVRRLRPNMLQEPTGFLKTVNNEAAYTSYLSEVTDGVAATVAQLDALGTLVQEDAIFIGHSEPFKGFSLELNATNKNSNVAVMAVHYWNGTSWTALTAEDGTKTHNTTLAHDGEVQWSEIPSDWEESTKDGVEAYWVRMTVSAALSANVDVEECGVMLDNGYVGRLDSFNVAASGKDVFDFAIAGDAIAILVRSLNSGTAAANINLGWH